MRNRVCNARRYTAAVCGPAASAPVVLEVNTNTNNDEAGANSELKTVAVVAGGVVIAAVSSHAVC